MILSIRRNSPATINVPRMYGSTTYQVACQRRAPSTRAASSSSSGSVCKAASTISMVSGDHSQVSARMIAGSAPAGSVIGVATLQPNALNAHHAGLMSGV